MLNGLPAAMQVWFVLGISLGTSEKLNYLRLKKFNREHMDICTYIHILNRYNNNACCIFH